MTEWGQKSKPKKIPGPKSNPSPPPLPTKKKETHTEILSRKNFQRNYAAAIRGNYHKSSVLNTQQNQATQKNICQHFPTKKNPKSKISNPQKILWSSLLLEMRSTPLCMKAPRSSSLPLYKPFLAEKVPLSYTFYWATCSRTLPPTKEKRREGAATRRLTFYWQMLHDPFHIPT